MFDVVESYSSRVIMMSSILSLGERRFGSRADKFMPLAQCQVEYDLFLEQYYSHVTPPIRAIPDMF